LVGLRWGLIHHKGDNFVTPTTAPTPEGTIFDEPINLWEVGKQIRVSCCRDEDVVVIERMEAKDLEVMKSLRREIRGVSYDYYESEYKRS